MIGDRSSGMVVQWSVLRPTCYWPLTAYRHLLYESESQIEAIIYAAETPITLDQIFNW